MPIGPIAHSHAMEAHFYTYADDTQLYFTFNPTSGDEEVKVSEWKRAFMT